MLEKIKIKFKLTSIAETEVSNSHEILNSLNFFILNQRKNLNPSSANATENIDYFKNYDFVLCEDTNKGDIYNALLYFKKPKHPLLKFWIEKIVENIEKKRYGSNALDITGPKCLGKLLLQKYPIQWKHGDIFFKKEKILFLQCKYYKKHILEPGYNTQIFHNNKVILERNRDYKNMKKYYSKQSKTNSYNDLWNKKKVYQ